MLTLVGINNSMVAAIVCILLVGVTEILPCLNHCNLAYVVSLSLFSNQFIGLLADIQTTEYHINVMYLHLLSNIVYIFTWDLGTKLHGCE